MGTGTGGLSPVGTGTGGLSPPWRRALGDCLPRGAGPWGTGGTQDTVASGGVVSELGETARKYGRLIEHWERGTFRKTGTIDFDPSHYIFFVKSYSIGDVYHWNSLLQ